MSDDFDIIKRPNTKSDYAEQDLIDLAMCVEDPLYFIRNFVRIQHATKGALPFNMFPFQENMIRAFHEQRFCVALTGRQLGKTSCSAAFILWKAMFTPDTGILIVAHNYAGALEIMDRIRYAYENLPNHIRAGIREYNKGTITFDNGSKITARATSTNATRGLSITLLYMDEFSFVRSSIQQDFWTAIMPILSTGGSCIITSTPKSDEDQFAQIWKGANENTDEYGNPLPTKVGRNGFFPIEVPWWDHPERDETWAKEFREKLGVARFRQEFECVVDDTKIQIRDKLGNIETINIGELYNRLELSQDVYSI